MTPPRRSRDRPPIPPYQAPLAILVTLVVFTLVVYATLMTDTAGSAPSTAMKIEIAEGKEGQGLGNLNPLNDMRAVEAIIQKEAEKAEYGLRSVAQHKKKQLKHALDQLSTRYIPSRIKALREAHQIVGERLAGVQAGTETVPELLNPNGKQRLAKKPPMELAEINDFLEQWLHSLHQTLRRAKQATFQGIWQAYHDLTVQTLYVWDREYLSRMPPRRDDNSIFLSVATYRDENCINTLNWAYEKASEPSKLFVGLVQQNCHKDCISGILEGGRTEPVEPDQDCYKAFCEGPMKAYCSNVRLLDVDEQESLGPYAARFFASKLWHGEQWFMQIDAHMTFAKDWDTRYVQIYIPPTNTSSSRDRTGTSFVVTHSAFLCVVCISSIKMLQAAPSKKPVLSHYPPGHMADLEAMKDKPGARLCGPIFATSDLESQIIRLERGDVSIVYSMATNQREYKTRLTYRLVVSQNFDKVHLDIPRFAPFTAAGYFVAHSDFLREVPFDPFLPWIFMGEEIIMSTRLWTSGYDIFSPTHSVVGHMYVRRHKPKFWESVHRAFHPGVHNELEALVLDRIKYQLGYPEAAKDMLRTKSLLTAVEQYSMGTERPLSRYLELVGLNMTTKEVTETGWCEHGTVPPGFEQFEQLYKENQ
jgi:[Skp1-protein]-hydroxyproline N-acetylglucosaminyltransferase